MFTYTFKYAIISKTERKHIQMSSCRLFICRENCDGICRNSEEACIKEQCSHINGNCRMCVQKNCMFKMIEAKAAEQRKNDIENKKNTVISTLQTKTDIPQNNEKEQKLKTERNEKPGETRMPCAYVDGSYNQYKKIYGYGGIFFDGEQTHIMQGHGNEPDMISMRNVAGEIEGAMAAIRYAKERDIKEFIMYYDYSGIEQWATGRWSANKTGTQKYQKYVQECGIKIHFKKIKGHSGNTGNEIADNLAKQAAGIMDRGYR